MVIDPTKSAYINGRSIVDNIITAEELIFSIQKHNMVGQLESGLPHAAVSVPIEQVFSLGSGVRICFGGSGAGMVNN